MTEAGQVGTLGGMQKACIARRDNWISTPVICYLGGMWRSQKFIFVHKMLFSGKKEKRKKKTQCASHKVHWPFKPQICNLLLGFYFNVIIYFYLFICIENYCRSMDFWSELGIQAVLPIKTITGFLRAAFSGLGLWVWNTYFAEWLWTENGLTV